MTFCPHCGHPHGEGANFCEGCGRRLEVASTEQRKTVTILFCDLAGSTSLGESIDAEALRVVLARYFERMKSIVERHGGTVEKFIGDAVMAVFGIPTLHEDDALRAVRAALEMRDALPELGLRGRIGVMTGEVVTGTGERLATGDAVNVAARLESAAPPGEVLIGQPTLDLVYEALQYETVEPLTLKGKAEPIPAFRAIEVQSLPERRHETPFVGRTREAGILQETWARAVDQLECALVTILGDPGMGKSRLAAELAGGVDATVVRGRCLPYGEGITYWPVVEVLKQLGAQATDEAPAAVIRSLLGETGTTGTADDIAWAFRKTLEAAAETRPILVVFDDIQWGEGAFLDLIEHVALLSGGSPMMLLCLARPELLDRRPAWPVTVRLDPLTADEAASLMSDPLEPGLRERILSAAAGNPLFIQEMLAMTSDARGEVAVPPTLKALIAARVDQLPLPERSLLERCAVEGEVFHRGSVQAVAPGEGQVTPRLAALVRKQFIRPDRAQLPGEDGFRFRHLLIRDAAYEGLSKSVRADLHEAFGEWLEQHGTTLIELDEIVGYHLEQACLYRAQLGLAVDAEVVGSARARLASAGSRAHLRQDYAAATALLDRALALEPDRPDSMVETQLVGAIFWAGWESEALDRARWFADRAAAVGDERAGLCARIYEQLFRTFLEPEGATGALEAVVNDAIPVFEAAGDDVGLYTAYRGRGQVAVIRGHCDELAAAYDLAARHAQRAGLGSPGLGWRTLGRLSGSTPIPDMLAWAEAQDPVGRRDLYHRGHLAVALAMQGRIDAARRVMAELREEGEDRGLMRNVRAIGVVSGTVVELLAGDPATAVELGERGCLQLEEIGNRGSLSTASACVAEAWYRLGRLNEALSRADRAAQLGATDDVMTQMGWRQVVAKVMARRGDTEKAEQLARQAVALGEPGDMLDARADSFADLAEVFELTGQPEAAVGPLRQASELYERKGNLVSLRRVRERLSRLGAATTG